LGASFITHYRNTTARRAPSVPTYSAHHRHGQCSSSMSVMSVFHQEPSCSKSVSGRPGGGTNPAGQPLDDVQAWRLWGHMPAVAIANPQVARFLSPETCLVSFNQ
jgi:hypothetical protein